MDYKVIIVPKAAKEIEEAAAWYAAESLVIAAKWRDELLAHITTLEQFPHRALPLARGNQIAKRDIRQLLYGKGRGQYRILLEIKEDIVLILSVRHISRYLKNKSVEKEKK